MYAAAASAVVVILALSFIVSMSPGPTHGTTSPPTSSSASQANSVQAGNQTYVATFESSLSTPAADLTTSTTSSASTTGPTTTASTTQTTHSQSLASSGGAFTYTPSSQVEVLSVAATVSGSQGGSEYVTFSVQYRNIGSGTIYVLGGGGSSLNATIESGSGVSTQVQKARCLMATAMVPVGPGQEQTSVTPGCWSGFYYVLAHPGTVGVQLTLTWSTDSTSANQSNVVVITAELNL